MSLAVQFGNVVLILGVYHDHDRDQVSLYVFHEIEVISTRVVQVDVAISRYDVVVEVIWSETEPRLVLALPAIQQNRRTQERCCCGELCLSTPHAILVHVISDFFPYVLKPLGEELVISCELDYCDSQLVVASLVACASTERARNR